MPPPLDPLLPLEPLEPLLDPVSFGQIVSKLPSLSSAHDFALRHVSWLWVADAQRLLQACVACAADAPHWLAFDEHALLQSEVETGVDPELPPLLVVPDVPDEEPFVPVLSLLLQATTATTERPKTKDEMRRLRIGAVCVTSNARAISLSARSHARECSDTHDAMRAAQAADSEAEIAARCVR